MKRILCIVGALGLIVSSCTKTEEFQNPNNGDTAVQFTANMATTRVTDDVDNPKFEALDEIGIFTTNGITITANSRYRIKESNKPEMEYAGTGDDKIFPPDDPTQYFAYHPYDKNATSFRLSVDVTAEYKNEPLVWARVTNASGANVDLQFYHQLVMLRLTFVAGGGDITTLEGATATLVGANTKGEFSIMTGGWNGSKYEKADLIINDISTTQTSKTATVYVMPMDNTSELLNVSIVIKARGKTFIWKVPTNAGGSLNGTWEKGQYYDYTIYVGN